MLSTISEVFPLGSLLSVDAGGETERRLLSTPAMCGDHICILYKLVCVGCHVRFRPYLGEVELVGLSGEKAEIFLGALFFY
jgi:hypothetical protein